MAAAKDIGMNAAVAAVLLEVNNKHHRGGQHCFAIFTTGFGKSHVKHKVM